MPGLLVEDEEREIIKKLAQFPELVAGSALAAEPHRVSAYLMELVGQFHSYYAKHRVVTDNQALSAARLNLMSGIKTVLAKRPCAAWGHSAGEDVKCQDSLASTLAFG